MIKGIINEKTLLLGLSRTNVERLLKNEPILIHASELPGPGSLGTVTKIVIMGGETEETMIEDLRAVKDIQTGATWFTQPGEGKHERPDQ